MTTSNDFAQYRALGAAQQQPPAEDDTPPSVWELLWRSRKVRLALVGILAVVLQEAFPQIDAENVRLVVYLLASVIFGIAIEDAGLNFSLPRE